MSSISWERVLLVDERQWTWMALTTNSTMMCSNQHILHLQAVNGTKMPFLRIGHAADGHEVWRWPDS